MLRKMLNKTNANTNNVCTLIDKINKNTLLDNHPFFIPSIFRSTQKNCLIKHVASSFFTIHNKIYSTNRCSNMAKNAMMLS
jgi:hypothetical protein